MSSDTEVKHPFFARAYIWLSRGRDPEVEHRQALLAGLEGRVIEVGAGNGLNFPHYPPEVTQVVAVELAPGQLLQPFCLPVRLCLV